MDIGAELSSQPASVHTDSETGLQLAKKHTDLEFGTQLSPEMHNDPKPELLADQLHSDPEPVKATVQEEKLSTSATESGKALCQETKYAPVQLVWSLSLCHHEVLYKIININTKLYDQKWKRIGVVQGHFFQPFLMQKQLKVSAVQNKTRL